MRLVSLLKRRDRSSLSLSPSRYLTHLFSLLLLLALCITLSYSVCAQALRKGHVRTVRRKLSATQFSPDVSPCWHLDIGLSASRAKRK